MKYFIIEIQKNQEGVYSHLITTADTRKAADAAYYGVLQYAALSNLPLHTACLLDETGLVYANKSYQQGHE